MIAKSHIKSYQKILIALALMFSLLSASSTPSIHASPSATETDPRRLTMLGIAEQYANYTWTATSANVWHPGSYGSGQTFEPPNPPHTINSEHPDVLDLYDTPNLGWVYVTMDGGWLMEQLKIEVSLMLQEGQQPLIKLLSQPTLIAASLLLINSHTGFLPGI